VAERLNNMVRWAERGLGTLNLLRERNVVVEQGRASGGLVVLAGLVIEVGGRVRIARSTSDHIGGGIIGDRAAALHDGIGFTQLNTGASRLQQRVGVAGGQFTDAGSELRAVLEVDGINRRSIQSLFNGLLAESQILIGRKRTASLEGRPTRSSTVIVGPRSRRCYRHYIDSRKVLRA